MVKSAFNIVLYHSVALFAMMEACNGHVSSIPKRLRSMNEHPIIIDQHDSRPGQHARKVSAGRFDRYRLRNRRQLESDMVMSLPTNAAAFELSMSVMEESIEAPTSSPSSEIWTKVSKEEFDSANSIKEIMV